MLRQKRKRGFVGVLTRHPSHFNIINTIKTPHKTMWRAGSTTELKTPGWIEINTIDSIKNCSNKLKMKTLFKEAGVQSPEFYSHKELRELEEIPFPILAKKKYRSRGIGMKKLDSQEDLDSFVRNCDKLGAYYFERYYNYAREYRIHVSSRGVCFYTNRKMRKRDAENRWFFNSSNCVWILETNPLFAKPDTWNNIVNDCVKALNSLGLDLAAADVRVNKKGEHQIIELNSAPSFGEGTLKMYQEEILNLIKIKK